MSEPIKQTAPECEKMRPVYSGDKESFNYYCALTGKGCEGVGCGKEPK